MNLSPFGRLRFLHATNDTPLNVIWPFVSSLLAFIFLCSRNHVKNAFKLSICCHNYQIVKVNVTKAFMHLQVKHLVLTIINNLHINISFIGFKLLKLIYFIKLYFDVYK